MSRSPLTTLATALVIATLCVGVGLARSAVPTRAAQGSNALSASVLDLVSCQQLPFSDWTGAGSKPGETVNGVAWMFGKTNDVCQTPADPATSADVVVTMSTDGAPSSCAAEPAIGYCVVLVVKRGLPSGIATAPQDGTCFGLVGASQIPSGLPTSGVDASIEANEDFGGTTFTQFCLVQGKLTPAATFSIPAPGSTDTPSVVNVPVMGAYDPTTSQFAFAVPWQLVRAGYRVEIASPDSTGAKLELDAYSSADASGPAAPAGMRTDVHGPGGSLLDEWTPEADMQLRNTLQRTQPEAVFVNPAVGATFFSGSQGGSGRTDAAVDAIKLTGIVGYQANQAPDQSTPWTCAPAAGLICGTKPAMPAGKVFVISANMAAPVPLSGTNFLVYDVAFDSDGKADNNTTRSVDFPIDPLQGTDVTYEVHYEPSIDKWSLVASDARIGPALNNKPSAAQAVVAGNSITFFIPASELDTAAPNYRVATTIGDADLSMAPDTTAVDAAPGGPDSGWPLSPMDVTDLNSLSAPVGPEPSKPTVTGGCITTQVGGPPIISQWHVVVRGLGKLPSPGLDVNLKTKNGTFKISGITLGADGATFPSAFATPGVYTVTSIVVEPKTGKAADVTKSFVAVFGKSFRISATDALSAGPDC